MSQKKLLACNCGKKTQRQHIVSWTQHDQWGNQRHVLAYFQSASWTASDEVLKQQIFADILEPNKCWYCGVGEMRDMDHFIPTNGRLFKPPMFGLEHDGNLIPSCKTCNANKSNKHPLEWLTTRSRDQG